MNTRILIFLVVSNPPKVLAKLAELHRRNFRFPLSELSEAMVKPLWKSGFISYLVRNVLLWDRPWSYNSQIGVPYLRVTDERIYRIGNLWGGHLWSRRDAGIAEYHQTYHRSVDQYRRCSSGKLLLVTGKVHGEALAFKDCEVVVYNGDNELLSNCVAKSMLTAREIVVVMVTGEAALHQ